MRWPWSKPEPERRESLPYTDALVSALATRAAGTVPADPSSLAALEAAAGLYAAAFRGGSSDPGERGNRGTLARVPGADRPRLDPAG